MPSPTARRRIAALALASAAVVSVGGLTTNALFTKSVTVGSNVLSTGNVDITAAPATAVLTAPAMAPGDSVTAPVTITNSGTAELRYAMTSTASGNTDLAAGLFFRVRSGVTTCSTEGFAATGTNVYGAATPSRPLGGSAAIAIFGAPTQGADAGDRTLAAGASETLCLQITLPTSAPNSLASKTTTATFTFAAEQTKNN